LFRKCGNFCFIFLMDLGTVPTVWYFLFYFLLDLGTVLTVWYFLFYFCNGSRKCSTVWYFLFYFSIGSRNCSDGVVFFVLFFYWIWDLFRRCGNFSFIFLMDLGTVPTVWFSLFYFSIGSRNCSDSVVFFVLFF
jgi:hypothetical protein